MKALNLLALLCSSVIFFPCSSQNSEGKKSIILKDIQVIGSHNSYKISIEKPLLSYAAEVNSSSKSLEYEHITLTDYLNLGLRGLELDVFNDAEGSYYSNPKGMDIVRTSGNSPLPLDVAEKLNVPGLNIFLVQEIDFRSHQLLFKDALL